MIKVITYGTYDLLHYGHIRLLERAKALGDYLIVGVTAEDFDKARGKINVSQSLMERIEAVRNTGLADEIIVEEYEGQKIDDVKRYDVDIFAIGDDWKGKFDYMAEYCELVYLQRTKGVSSTELRSERSKLRLGLVGKYNTIKKFAGECSYVNGLVLSGICTDDVEQCKQRFESIDHISSSFDELLDEVDAIYVCSHPSKHFEQIKVALERNVHVLCESPIALSVKEYEILNELAKKNGLVLMDSIKTAYSMAYNRLVLMVKTGKIGEVVSVDTICTSLADLQMSDYQDLKSKWNSICAWGPTAMLPILQILGTDYKSKQITSYIIDEENKFDYFTKIAFVYPSGVASIKVGKGVKSEGEMIISGTKGYIYVPAPWWKTEYFEIRFEDSACNKRYFYQLDGEGIRYELVSFMKAIQTGKDFSCVSENVSSGIVGLVEDYYTKKDFIAIK